MIEVSKEKLVEIIDDAVSWMQAAKKENPKLLLPAWVAQWSKFRPTKDTPDLGDAFAESELSNDELDPLFDII